MPRTLRTSPFGVLALIAAIAILAIAWLMVLSTLSNAFRAQQEIREAIALNDEALFLQVDEETALRGYVVAHKADFLEPYRAAQPLVPKTLDALATVAAELDLTSARGSIAEMRRIHDRWMTYVALPASAATPAHAGATTWRSWL